MTVLKTRGQKYQKTIKIFKKCATINFMWCKEAAQPIRDESFPYLPSKLISVVHNTAVFTFIAFISELKYNNILLLISREAPET
jgi:hypothetical protein